MPQPEVPAPLSDAARDVRHELETIARDHQDASGPELVLLLARSWCPARLRRGERKVRRA